MGTQLLIPAVWTIFIEDVVLTAGEEAIGGTKNDKNMTSRRAQI